MSSPVTRPSGFGDIRIEPYVAVRDTGGVDRILDDIFFSSSGTSSFASPADKAAFRHRWLGRYLLDHPDDAFAAVAPASPGSAARTPVGYLVGSMIDPALDPANRGLGYVPAFAALSAVYPAHVHLNLAADCRSGGIGVRLIDAFAAHLATSRVTDPRLGSVEGFHVVTAKGMRNVGFYERNGFRVRGETDWNDRTFLFLARDC